MQLCCASLLAIDRACTPISTQRVVRNVRSFATSSEPSAEAVRNAEKMLDLMTSSPSLQQMMWAVMPPSMRNNDTLKAMLADPAVKQRIARLMAERGLSFPAHINPGHMEDTVRRMARMGINVTELPRALMSYPGLLQKLQEPRVMQAFLETTDNPAAAAKYGEEVMAVVRKVQEVLRTRPAGIDKAGAKDATVVGEAPTGHTSHSRDAIPLGPPPVSQPAPSPGATPSAQPSPPSPAAVPFMQLLMTDPTLAPKLQSPRVQKALEEISKSPWKTIKYVFDKEVMEVFTALNKLLKNGPPKPPGPHI